MSTLNNDPRFIHASDWMEDPEAAGLPVLSAEERELAESLIAQRQSIRPDAAFAASLEEDLMEQFSSTKPSRDRSGSFPASWKQALATLRAAGRFSLNAAGLALLVLAVVFSISVLPPRTPTSPQVVVLLTASPTLAAASTHAAVWDPALTPTASSGVRPSAPSQIPSTKPLATPGTRTQEPTPTPTPVPCNQAEFVEDVTIPDGALLMPGSPFTKIWRLKNTGACTWTDDYGLVFVGGDSMGGLDGAQSAAIPQPVAPGQTVDVRVSLVAPEKPGAYTGSWMMQSPEGRFGLGPQSAIPFYVQVKVKKESEGPFYDFAANYCAAVWSNGEKVLPCPGKETDEAGFVIYLDKPYIETRHEDEPALWTQPEKVKDGLISGTFPAFQVQRGDRFVTDTGCLAENLKCSVLFQILYRVEDGPVKLLDEWEEISDKTVTRVDLDLSALAGERVQFTLVVKANGPFRDDAAFWLVPQIRR